MGYYTTAEIVKIVNKLIDRCGTRDPYKVAKELGINIIELMPAYEFMESGTCKNSESEKMVSEKHTQGRVNFWGYMYGYYFAPKRSYCATDDPEKEFKTFIKKLHQAGIACIMEMYFSRECNPVTIDLLVMEQ